MLKIFSTKKFLTLNFIILVLFFLPSSAFAANYGDGAYGAGAYGSGASAQATTTTTTSSSIAQSIATFFCTDQAPTSGPKLYQIDNTSTTAKLYFSPAGTPYTTHYVSYGQANSSEGYGVEFSTGVAKGAIVYQVNKLTANTVYTFKVRGGNGCKPGPWSESLTIKTQPKNIKTVFKYYPKNQAKIAVQANKKQQVLSAMIHNILPIGAPATGQGVVKNQIKSISETVEQVSFWGKVTSFFLHLF